VNSKILWSLTILIFFLFPAYGDSQNLNSTDIFLEKARDAINASDYESAIKFLDQILEDEPENSNVLRNKGAILGSLERFDEAVEIFQSVIKIDPQNNLAFYNLARSYYELEKFYDASTYIERAMQINPDHLESKILRNRIFVQTMEPIDGILQVEVRNSDGRLVGYTETTKLLIFKYDTTVSWISQLNMIGIVNIDEKEFGLFEDIKVLKIENSTVQNFIGTAMIKIKTNYAGEIPGIIADTFGIPYEKGDTLTHFWKFIVPLS